MKKCRKCNIEKPLPDYYKHKQMFDGYLNICKECTKKRIGIHRENNINEIRAYDRKRGKTPKRKALVKEVNQRPKRIKYKLEYTKNERAEFPERVNAFNAVKRAIKKGKLIKPWRCEKCNKKADVQGYHKDYNKKLDVIWLCSSCHCKIHAKRK